MAYIQSTTPLDDNKETTGTSGGLITPALNSSSGDPQATSNAAVPPSSPAVIQPTQEAAQQGTGFVNLGTYLDKNQGASQHLTGALNSSITGANTSAAQAAALAAKNATATNVLNATKASDKAISTNTLAQDIGGRTQLLRNLSPVNISQQGLGLDQYLVQHNFAPPEVQDGYQAPTVNTPAAAGSVDRPFTGTPAVIEKPKEQVKFSPTFAPKMPGNEQNQMYADQNTAQLHNLAASKNIAIFNPMAQVTSPGANYQAGWGVNQADNEAMARTYQANMQQQDPQSHMFNINQMNLNSQPGMYNVNAAMAQKNALDRLSQTYK